VSGTLKNEAPRSDEPDFMQLLDAVHCMDNCKGMMMLIDAYQVIEKLEAENERLRETLGIQFPGLVEISKDAERYRWLRTFATWVNDDYESIHYRWNAGEFVDVDAAIDAAMRQGE